MSDSEIQRAIKKIKQAINLLEVDLSGMNVLTEVGSNYFALTPVIALMAGASKVFAWTKDSSFGKGIDNVKQCEDLLKYVEYSGEIIYSIEKRPVEHIRAANIITNSGFVRPLNEGFLKQINPNSTVIPLMYEAWEFRDSDIDIVYCKDHNIKVAGTWENHPAIKVFSGTGALAVKLAMEAGFEVYQNNIIIWSDDHFGEEAKKSFEAFGANEVLRTVDFSELLKKIPDVDFIYICDYSEKRPYFSDNGNGVFDIHKIKELNPAIQIIHLYGSINVTLLEKHQISVYPHKNGYPSVMTFTLAYLGMTPLIRLQAGGLKTGEVLYKNQYHKISQII